MAVEDRDINMCPSFAPRKPLNLTFDARATKTEKKLARLPKHAVFLVFSAANRCIYDTAMM